MSDPAICTSNLGPLGSIDAVRRVCQSLAMLDAILMDDPRHRYYRFESGPHRARGDLTTSAGDGYVALFVPAGAIIKGFDGNSPMGYFAGRTGKPWPGVMAQVPPTLESALRDEPDIDLARTSFCIWRQRQDDGWQRGPVDFAMGYDPDGSKAMLAMLGGESQRYRAWAEAYYEMTLPLVPLAAVYRHEPLTADLVNSLNRRRRPEDVEAEARRIGYPAP